MIGFSQEAENAPHRLFEGKVEVQIKVYELTGEGPMNPGAVNYARRLDICRRCLARFARNGKEAELNA
jgi:hypothetical protein